MIPMMLEAKDASECNGYTTRCTLICNCLYLQGLEPDVQVKWPNDIYSSGVKIGGTLIHTTYQGNSFNVLTGVGINVSNAEPTTCINQILARQLAAAGGSAVSAAGDTRRAGGVTGGDTGDEIGVSRELLLAHIMNALERCFNVFKTQGFAPLEREYLSCWMHHEQQVQLEEEGGGRLVLTIKGLTQHGFLLAVDGYGQRYELTPDGNSLDMMQGLIKRKLT
jgi:biotin--protein ligase